jgi:hypothetical protein
MIPRVIAVSLVMVLACFGLLLGGCSAAGNSPTGGYALDLRVMQGETNLAVYYGLQPSGELVYSAGRNILSVDNPAAYPVWTAKLDETQLAPIMELLRRAETPEAEPVDTNPALPVYKVTLRTPERSFARRYESAPTPWLTELRRRLDTLQRKLRDEALPFPDLKPVR